MSDKCFYRAIQTSLPDDEDFRKLSERAKLVFYTLKVGRLNNAAGIFTFDEGSKMTLSLQTGIPYDELDQYLIELEKAKWIIRDYPILWIRNSLKKDPLINLDNGNHRKSVMRLVSSLPKRPLIVSYLKYYGFEILPDCPPDTLPNTPRDTIPDTIPDSINDTIPNTIQDTIVDQDKDKDKERNRSINNIDPNNNNRSISAEQKNENSGKDESSLSGKAGPPIKKPRTPRQQFIDANFAELDRIQMERFGKIHIKPSQYNQLINLGFRDYLVLIQTLKKVPPKHPDPFGYLYEITKDPEGLEMCYRLVNRYEPPDTIVKAGQVLFEMGLAKANKRLDKAS